MKVTPKARLNASSPTTRLGLLTSIVIALTTLKTAPVRADLVINEFFADPYPSGDANGDGITDAIADEFVEIVNTGDASVNLYEYSIEDGVQTRHVFPLGTTLCPGQAIVVFGGGTHSGDFGGSEVQFATGGSLGLNNDGDTVTLKDSDGNVLDSFTYTGTGDAAGDDDQSITRDPDLTGNFIKHTLVSGAAGAFSPGFRVDGTAFDFQDCVTTYDLVINEIHADPSNSGNDGDANADCSNDTYDDEFVEIVNSGSNMIDLAQFWIEDNIGLRHVFPTGTILCPGQAIVVFGGGNPSGYFGEAIVQTASTGALELTNAGGDTVTLFDAGGNVVASFTYTDSQGSNNQSITRSPDLIGNFKKHSEVLQDFSPLYSPGLKVDGSPFEYETCTSSSLFDLVINEIHADPASGTTGDANGDGTRDSSEDEFVEIVNVGPTLIDMEGFEIRDSVGARHIFPAGTILCPGQALVVFGGEAPVGDFGGSIIQIASTGTLALNNGGDTVTLIFTDTSTSFEISVQYGSEGGDDQSLTRNPDLLGNFERHTEILEQNSPRFTPGFKVDGTAFEFEYCIPSSPPSSTPSLAPSLEPTSVPSFRPSTLPSSQPSSEPSLMPSRSPSDKPSLNPSYQPSTEPSLQPSSHPSANPSLSPSSYPSTDPSFAPTVTKSAVPSSNPSLEPSTHPSSQPSSQPSSSSKPSESPPLVLISAIQGTNGNDGNGGDVSPFVGRRVAVEAIVVGIFLGSEKLEGFFLQEEDEDADRDPRTSEGIFVYYPIPVNGVDMNGLQEGDKVSLIGRVSEYYTQTEIISVDLISILSSGNPLPSPATIDLKNGNYGVFSTPNGYVADLERFEGMLVRFDDKSTMTVTEISNFDRYGELLLTDGNVPIHYSQANFPSVSGYDSYLQRIASLQVVLDDGSNTENPDLTDFLAFDGAFNTATAVRIGDEPTSDLVGCLGFSFGRYRINPTSSFEFKRKDKRPKPTIMGKSGKNKKELTIAVTDVSNYFATLDMNGNQVGPNNDQDPRGADSTEEFERQTDKLVTALLSLDSDVLGLVQVENNFGETSAGNAVKTLVENLNEISGETFDWVRPKQDGITQTYVDESDAISNAFIYNSASLSVTGVNVLTDSNLPGSFVPPIFDGVNSNRGTLAVTFHALDDRRRQLRDRGLEGRSLELFDSSNSFLEECITIVLCHFKSKGFIAGDVGNEDKGDGAGENNAIRLLASQAVVEWLKGNPTGFTCPNVMIMGNLNAYLKEDPIQYFLNNGFRSLIEEDKGTFMADGYWGSLDYHLYNERLYEKVKDFGSINFNSFESDALDYNLYPSRDPTWFDESVPYRYSDHDPLVTEVKL